MSAFKRTRVLNGRAKRLMSKAIFRISQAYESDNRPWIVGYSGGKDSTAVLKLLFHALLSVKSHSKMVNIIYSNTGVQIPYAVNLAEKALHGFEREYRRHNLPMKITVIQPELTERFFVKVIGRGYPPPTDKFRWCTDRLLIRPLNRFLRDEDFEDVTIVLGVRKNESSARNLTLKETKAHDYFFRIQKGYASKRLFMPILDFETEHVWATNLLIDEPKALRGREVADLYAHASQRPMVRNSDGAPYGEARFGCWPCTVARHGVTLRNMINSGKKDLTPLLDFRLWLESERNDPSNRWKRRRNGQPGPGPMTIQWRKRALAKLLSAQEESGLTLIKDGELAEIRKTWRKE